jgi:hypothetical protein
MIIKSRSPRQQQLGDPHQDLHTEPKILGDTLTADLLSRKKKIARLLRDQNQLEKLAANRGQLQYPAWISKQTKTALYKQDPETRTKTNAGHLTCRSKNGTETEQAETETECSW